MSVVQIASDFVLSLSLQHFQFKINPSRHLAFILIVSVEFKMLTYQKDLQGDDRMVCGQSYKDTTIVIFASRVINISYLLVSTTRES